MTPRDAALSYADRGWHVFPVRPGTKRPYVFWGSTEPATTAAATIHGWWTRWPRALVGIACKPSRLVVVDLDGPEASAAFEALQRQHGPLPPTRWARTRRGWHAYWRDESGEIGSPIGKLGPGIDVRGGGHGAGAYVLAPPGPHREWWNDLDPAPVPAWLHRLLVPPPPPPRPPWRAGPPRAADKYAAAALRGELERILIAVEGTRNATVNAAAYALGRLVAAGQLDEQEVAEQLLSAALAAGLGEAESRRTIHSGLAARTRGMA